MSLRVYNLTEKQKEEKVIDKEEAIVIYKFSGDSNCYLLLSEDPILIDTGNAIDKEELKTEIEKVIKVSEIKHVLLTHMHYDHVGNTDLFEKATFYASRVAIQDLNRDAHGTVLRKKEEQAMLALLKKRRLEIVYELQGIKIIPTPGHTRGSVCYYYKKQNILFSGDTKFETGIGRTDLPTSNQHMMYKSLKALDKYNDALLCPGHDY